MRARGAIFLVPTTKDMLEEADLVLGRHKVLGLRSDNEPIDERVIVLYAFILVAVDLFVVPNANGS